MLGTETVFDLATAEGQIIFHKMVTAGLLLYDHDLSPMLAETVLEEVCRLLELPVRIRYRMDGVYLPVD